jgi:glycosyltransferase involved in cell wall biosynthesis
MPVYNGQPYLSEAISSVLAQTWTDLELVVVDDGSTDGSTELVRSFADDRIVLVTLSHGGIVSALNTGLERCRAELVARLDADDVMEPDRLERQVAFLAARPDLGGAASYHWIIDETGRVTGSNEPALLTADDVTRHLASGGRLVYPHPTVIYRRSVVLGLGGYDREYEKSEDVELFLRMHEAGRPLVVQPERLTRMRYHHASVTASSTVRQFYLDGLVHENHHRRQQGRPTLSLDEHVARLTRSPLARADTWAQLRSALLLRRHHQHRVAGRRGRATAYLAGAALLNPRKPLSRLRRQLQGR